MPTEPKPDVLLVIADKHLSLIAKYNPYRNFAGVKDRKAFAALIAKDPAFSSFGFGDDRYVVARIGGNLITSLHRKIGDMYEEMFRYLLECRFDLSAADLSYKVDVEIETGHRPARRTDYSPKRAFHASSSRFLPAGPRELREWHLKSDRAIKSEIQRGFRLIGTWRFHSKQKTLCP